MSHAPAPTLEAQSRTITGKKVKTLRREGLIPAVVYGHKQEAASLTLEQRGFEKLFHTAGSSTLVDLKVDGKAPVKVLIHDVQVDAVKHHITHADFYLVNLKEKLTTEIPVKFVGVADAVELEGGIFVTVKDELEVECLPQDLVSEIEIDISSLKTFDDTITAKDITMPAGIELLMELDQVIASISEPISEEELAELDEAPVADATTEFETTSGTETPVEDGAAEEAPKAE